MFEPTTVFSSFSVVDALQAREFYRGMLGLEVVDEGYGSTIHLPGGTTLFFYPKGEAHVPATYTILNFVVTDIDAAVAELKHRGMSFDQNEYTDNLGIQRGIMSARGPDQAWFKDPSGNILSVLKLAR